MLFIKNQELNLALHQPICNYTYMHVRARYIGKTHVRFFVER